MPESLLDQWLEWASRSRLAPFVKLARTIRKHAVGILAYLDTRMTNGPVEAINNKLRVIARRAYGFHSYGALISMLFLCCGASNWSRPYPHAFKETQNASSSLVWAAAWSRAPAGRQSRWRRRVLPTGRQRAGRFRQRAWRCGGTMRHMEERSMFFQGIARVVGTVSELLDDGEPPGSRSRAVRVVRIFWHAACLVREADESRFHTTGSISTTVCRSEGDNRNDGGGAMGSTLRILFVIVATATGGGGRAEGQPPSSERSAAAETTMVWLDDTAVSVPVDRDPDSDELATVLVGLRRPASMQVSVPPPAAPPSAPPRGARQPCGAPSVRSGQFRVGRVGAGRAERKSRSSEARRHRTDGEDGRSPGALTGSTLHRPHHESGRHLDGADRPLSHGHRPRTSSVCSPRPVRKGRAGQWHCRSWWWDLSRGLP